MPRCGRHTRARRRGPSGRVVRSGRASTPRRGPSVHRRPANRLWRSSLAPPCRSGLRLYAWAHQAFNSGRRISTGKLARVTSGRKRPAQLNVAADSQRRCRWPPLNSKLGPAITDMALMRTLESESRAKAWRYGLIKSASVGFAAVAFLVTLHLVGSGACSDSGGRVVNVFYCQLHGAELTSFPKLLHPTELLSIVVPVVLLSGLLGWHLWRKYASSDRSR